MVSEVGGAFLSAFLQVLFDRLASRELIKFFRVQSLDDKLLKNLKITLLTVNAVLDDAEEKQITNLAVKEWLDELKDAVYHAEDLLDKIATEALRCKLEAESANQVQNPFKKDIEDEVENIINKLEYIAERKDRLRLKESVGGKRSQRLPTTSLVNEIDVCGRVEDKEEIISLLGSDDACGNEICVITLVGMGGIGKTTLAQLVYNDNKAKDFDPKAWVCVSEEFDVLRVTQTILEAVSSSACDIKDLNLLQVRLKEILTGKKFLLVLDDVWNENYIDWDILRSPFRSAARGSKIIVTTRNENVASIMRTGHTRYLKELPYEDCWTLFAKHAFENGDSTSAHPNLVDIGKKIVKKCNGLPLAAKTLGGLLYSKVEAEGWDNILNSEIWDLPNGKSNILPALRLSYYYLPSHLKRCFAYCSIFPKGNEFKTHELVLLWMAEGFLLPANGKKRMEEVGDEYFRELLSRSFFQQSNRNKSCFTMHDLVNDLAQFVSGEFCFKLEDGKLREVSEKARHLWYSRDKYDAFEIFEAFDEVLFLRTFLPSNFSYSRAPRLLNHIVSHELLLKLRWLRVLSLPHYWITELPDEIGNLKHLRYLDLSHTAIKRLPDSTCSLYNLQTLTLSGCNRLTELPTDTQKLINLRHLHITGTGLKGMPKQFSRLKSLQSLSIFLVSRDSGSKISELGELFHLHGTLTISKLQNVVCATDASGANLKNKEYLEELIFKWDTGIDGLENVTDVLDKLRPHENLRRLTINHYSGTSFPDWLGDASFSNIMFLHLGNCKKCSSLPPLWQLASLRELFIEGLNGVKKVGSEFFERGSSSLEILRLKDMFELEQFSFGGEGGEFPSLRELYIQSCPKLTGNLPDYLPLLVKLVISGCQQLVASLPRVPALRELRLNGCNALNSLPEGMMPDNLQLLSLGNCDNLTPQIEWDLQRMTSLVHFEIEGGCSNVESFPEEGMLPTALTYLRISGFSNLKSLDHNGFQNLTSLETLEIDCCNNLQSMPEETLPTSLSSLILWDCCLLEPRCQRNVGEDWPKISHILNIHINGVMV